MRTTARLTQKQYDALIQNLEASLAYIETAQQTKKAEQECERAREEIVLTAKFDKDLARKLLANMRSAQNTRDQAHENQGQARARLDETARKAHQELHRTR